MPQLLLLPRTNKQVMALFGTSAIGCFGAPVVAGYGGYEQFAAPVQYAAAAPVQYAAAPQVQYAAAAPVQYATAAPVQYAAAAPAYGYGGFGGASYGYGGLGGG